MNTNKISYIIGHVCSIINITNQNLMSYRTRIGELYISIHFNFMMFCSDLPFLRKQIPPNPTHIGRFLIKKKILFKNAVFLFTFFLGVAEIITSKSSGTQNCTKTRKVCL